MDEEIDVEIVEVIWVDAQSSLECSDIDSLAKIKLESTHSCGYLLHQDKEKLVLGFMIFGEGLIKHYQIIPIKMVKKIIKLGSVKE